MKSIVKSLLLLALASVATACGGGGGDSAGGSSGGTNYACSYESRHTGCNNSVYTAWTEGCFSFNSENYNISPQQVCTNVTTGGLACAAGCCITTQYQHVALNAGSCP
jgi:hypothetical protein